MNNSNLVLVVGATGLLGTQICRLLIQQKKKVRALVRSSSDQQKVKTLKDMGIETVVADVKDPASLTNVFTGVSQVITTVSCTISRSDGDSIDTVDRQGQINVVEAAVAAGVQHFIYVSFFQSPEIFPLQDAKHIVEKKIQDSKMKYTILRPTFFTEIWLSPFLGFEPQNGKATIYGEGKNKITWVSISNVADFAVAALDNPAAVNKIIDIGGPESLSPLEVVKMFETREKKKIEVNFIPLAALRAQKEAAEEPLSESFTALMITYAGGAEIPMKETAEEFKVKLLSVKDVFGLN